MPRWVVLPFPDSLPTFEYSPSRHFLEIDVGFRFHLLTFWAAIADVRFWSPAFMRTFLRTCQPKRLLQRLSAKIAVSEDEDRDISARRLAELT